MFTERLTEHLGLINLQLKGATPKPLEKPMAESAVAVHDAETDTPAVTTADEPPQLDKAEFRSLVNMLKAINHECQYENLTYQDDHWVYQFGDKQLVFKQLDSPDDAKQLHLCTLSELISQPELKRPVWEKLKTLNT